MFDITGMLIIVSPLVAVILILNAKLKYANQIIEETKKCSLENWKTAIDFESKYIECRDSEKMIDGRIIETIDTHRIYLSNVKHIKRIDNLPVEKMYQREVNSEYLK